MMKPPSISVAAISASCRAVTGWRGERAAIKAKRKEKKQREQEAARIRREQAQAAKRR